MGLVIVAALVPRASGAPGFTRVSVSSSGRQGNTLARFGPHISSGSPSISADGRLVAFSSVASTLAPRDHNLAPDVFVRDVGRARTTRVSSAADGRAANGSSWCPRISANGRFVAYISAASNLVAGDLNRKVDIFVYDRLARRTTRASVGSGRGEVTGCPAISADGRFVAFTARVDYWVTVYVRDRRRGTTLPMQSTWAWNAWALAFSADGRRLVWAIESGASDDPEHYVMLSDTSTGASQSLPGGSGSSPTISADGRIVAYTCYVLDERDVVRLFDTRTGRSWLPFGQPSSDGHSSTLSLSAHGRFLLFESNRQLTADDDDTGWDWYLYDRVAGTTSRLAQLKPASGADAGAAEGVISMTPDARLVALESSAPLVAGDTNHASDVFRHGPIR
jgi:Tol biopolymer transport system component